MGIFRIGGILEKWEDKMKRCQTCKHWTPTTLYDYEGAINDGKCLEIRDKMEITLHTGWDGGYVDYIETESDFGCTLHEEK